MEARKLMKPDAVHLHNEFLLAIFSKCQTHSSTFMPKSPPSVPHSHSHASQSKQLKKNKVKKKPSMLRSSFQQRFVPVNPMSCGVTASYKGAEDTVFASRELSLPDTFMIHGRLMVCAWEMGLSNVEESAVALVMQAVENQLKTIITQALSRKNGYRLRENRFKFGMGCQVSNPYTRHRNLLSSRTTLSEPTMISDTAQHLPNKRLPTDCNDCDLAQSIAAGSPLPCNKEPVSLYNLLDALQLYRSSIPSHTVYATAVERIIHKLWHPGYEDMEEEEAERKKGLSNQGSPVKLPAR